MSYRCLVYVVEDGSKIADSFPKELREAQIAARRGVIVIVKARRMKEVLPHIRDALLNNIVMGIVLLTVDELAKDSLAKSLAKFVERKAINDAKVIYEESLEGLANDLSRLFREWSIDVSLAKV